MNECRIVANVETAFNIGGALTLQIFKKLVVHNPSYRVNFQNIGGACAPAAPSMFGASVYVRHTYKKVRFPW